MNTYHLNQQELNRLWLAHHTQRDKQMADRLKAVYLLGMGWEVAAIATALLISENSVRNYYKTYQDKGIQGLESFYYESHHHILTEQQLEQLEQHLRQVVYLRIKDIIAYVRKRFQVNYSWSGMRDVLHRLDFVYKRPKLCAAKSDRKKQQQFIRKYRDIQANLGTEDSIYFMDATHPHYQTIAGYGWIKRGETIKLPLTLTQQPLNINGAINIETIKGVFLFERKTLKQEHTADLLLALRKQQPRGKIYLISDRGGCYYASAIKKFAKGLGIQMVYLPPYSPNLNIIERLWLYFEKKVLYNQHYESFAVFDKACQRFFKQLSHYQTELRSLLTDNFQLVDG